MLLAALKRLQSPSFVRNTRSLYCCSRPYAQLNSPVVFRRFASVKSELPPASRKSRKATEIPPAENLKVPRSSVSKSIPSSVEKGAPPLVTKAASVLAKETAKSTDPVAKSTPTTKSPPQKTHPPPPTETIPLSASIPPEIPSVERPLKSPTLVDKAEADFTETTPPPAPAVGVWLLISSVLVLVVVIVGGVTRLTESGLSITEWRPITGIMPPLSAEAWDEEFSKYKATPEFKMMNHSSSLDDFKRIYYMEWSHRILGRLVGLVFVAPLAYFTITKKISTPLAVKLGGLGLLIGAQGALGWYMVQSGMEDSLLETPGAVPRVSHYRLAAHLALAFALYTGMFSTGMAIIKDWRFARTGLASGLPLNSFASAMSHPIGRRFKSYSWVLTGLVLLTALSGVFVAGLDAGLVYNEWPLMGGRIAPPADELFSPAYTKNESKSDLWRNIFENPTTVQFDHRVLATTTYTGMALLFAQTFRPAWRAMLPPLAVMSARAAFAMANVQVLLGISTLIYLVPVPLAAAHQGGSILLLSAMLQLLIAMRRPSAAARAWRSVMTTKGAAKDIPA
ncbi:cytochrome oxidase assembly protein-domain-containing protein [Mycena capillaripes]|nr:cytochrome oxidase assembly protein-domain-containing protein [Mycena capillaripes]